MTVAANFKTGDKIRSSESIRYGYDNGEIESVNDSVMTIVWFKWGYVAPENRTGDNVIRSFAYARDGLYYEGNTLIELVRQFVPAKIENIEEKAAQTQNESFTRFQIGGENHGKQVSEYSETRYFDVDHVVEVGDAYGYVLAIDGDSIAIQTEKENYIHKDVIQVMLANKQNPFKDTERFQIGDSVFYNNAVWFIVDFAGNDAALQSAFLVIPGWRYMVTNVNNLALVHNQDQDYANWLSDLEGQEILSLIYEGCVSVKNGSVWRSGECIDSSPSLDTIRALFEEMLYNEFGG